MIKREYRAHVLVLPFPLQGHITPMLQFCKHLVSRAGKATLVITEHLNKSVHTDPNGPMDVDTISDGYNAILSKHDIIISKV